MLVQMSHYSGIFLNLKLVPSPNIVVGLAPIISKRLVLYIGGR